MSSRRVTHSLTPNSRADCIDTLSLRERAGLRASCPPLPLGEGGGEGASPYAGIQTGQPAAPPERRSSMPSSADHRTLALDPTRLSTAAREHRTRLLQTPTVVYRNRTVRQQNPTESNQIEPFHSKRLDAMHAALTREPNAGAKSPKHPVQPFNRSSLRVPGR